MVALVAGLLSPAAALASGESDWTITNSITNTSTAPGEKISINVTQCRDLFDLDTSEVRFVLATASSDVSFSSDAQYSIKYAIGNESCSKNDLEEVSGDSCETLVSKKALAQGTSRIDISRRVEKLSSATNADGCESLAETGYLYLIVSDPESGLENKYTVTVELDFRTARPDAPASPTVTAGGESLKVKWESVADAASYKVYYSTESLTAGSYPDEIDANTATSTSTSITIKEKVSAGNTYYVGITTIDSKGNESVLSEVATVETVASKDFWDSYRAENQDVDGGFCFIATAAYGSTQESHVQLLRSFRDNVLMPTESGRAFVQTYYEVSPPFALLIKQHPALRALARYALWPVYGFAWMYMYHPVLLWTLLLLFVAGIAALIFRRRRTKAARLAQAARHVAPVLAAVVAAGAIACPDEAYAESPVSMMAEFKAGPYTPDSLGGAFKKHFRDDSGFIVEGEYDWQFWRGVGSLGLGFHLAYGKIEGKSVEDSGEESIDSTALHWLPLRLSLVYRFDYLWTRFHFPFTIYAKAGFDYAVWWVVDGADSVAKSDDGKDGYGGTFGFHVVAGIAFVLDWLAPDMEKAFDVEWGINNSYIFAEFMYTNIKNFGADGAFDLSDTATFQIGLGLEF